MTKKDYPPAVAAAAALAMVRRAVMRLELREVTALMAE
jgi:hypothetical protein